jgi:hypothetical protein
VALCKLFPGELFSWTLASVARRGVAAFVLLSSSGFARDLPSRVATIFTPDDMRQTILVFLPEGSGTVAPHHLPIGTWA